MTSSNATIPSNFDPTDPKHRVSDKFQPDKEAQWDHPKEQDGWMWAHNAIRFDLEQFLSILEDMQAISTEKNEMARFQQWEVDALQLIFGTHEACIREHHEMEDDVFAPFFKQRFHYPDKLCDDHEGLITALTKASKTIQNIQPGESKKDILPDLIVDIAIYQSNLFAHLKEEEDMGLPLMRAYFTHKEYEIFFKSYHKKPDKIQLGWFIYGNGGQDKFRAELMKNHRIPFFVWYIVFWPGLKKYERTIVPKVNALKSGVEPEAKRTCLQWLISKIVCRK